MLDAEFLEESFDAGDSEAVSGVFDVFGAVCAEDVCREGTNSRQGTGVFSDAGGIFLHGDIADVVGFVFDAPVPANGVGGIGCGDGVRTDIVCGFVVS